MITVEDAVQLKENIGCLITCPLERSVDLEMLQNFTHISQDRSAIHHADAESVIVPGNLLISLLPAMLQSGMVVRNFDHCKTVSIEKLRFKSSVSLDRVLKLEFQIRSVKQIAANCFVSTDITLKLSADDSIVLTALQTDCFIS